EVYVDDMNVPKIDYVDEASPFTHGNVGIRAHHAASNFDNFTVSYVAPPPTFDAGVADASVDSSITDAAGILTDSSVTDAAGVLAVFDASAPVDAAVASTEASCGCRVAGSGSMRAPPAAVALFGLASLVARRRRRRRA